MSHEYSIQKMQAMISTGSVGKQAAEQSSVPRCALVGQYSILLPQPCHTVDST